VESLGEGGKKLSIDPYHAKKRSSCFKRKVQLLLLDLNRKSFVREGEGGRNLVKQSHAITRANSWGGKRTGKGKRTILPFLTDE